MFKPSALNVRSTTVPVNGIRTDNAVIQGATEISTSVLEQNGFKPESDWQKLIDQPGAWTFYRPYLHKHPFVMAGLRVEVVEGKERAYVAIWTELSENWGRMIFNKNTLRIRDEIAQGLASRYGTNGITVEEYDLHHNYVSGSEGNIKQFVPKPQNNQIN